MSCIATTGLQATFFGRTIASGYKFRRPSFRISPAIHSRVNSKIRRQECRRQTLRSTPTAVDLRGLFCRSFHGNAHVMRDSEESLPQRNRTRLALLPAVTCLTIASLSFVSLPVWAQREPVLKQIDVPHPYYFREMYLPQLTTGPSSVAWAPDSRSVVYSMAGSLWRQPLDSTVAEQLTAGPGYDYQPDCSSDGRWVVYASYAKDAMELWALNLETKRSQQLTQGGAVNVEPRFSPDGKRVV